MAGLLKKVAAQLMGSVGLTDTRLMNWATGGETYSGERVTVDSALQLDTVFACARLVAQTIATLPVMLYQRGEGVGQSKVATQHTLYRVLHDKPNADMTAVEFWTCMVACKLLWGNSYASISRRSDRSVISLDPMRPDRVQIDLQLDGSRTYTYTWNGVTTVYQEEDVLHLKGFTLDGMTGVSAIFAGRNSLGTAIGAERTAGRIFKNGMRPSGYLSIPEFLSGENRQKARDYIKSFQGSDNVGHIPMFEGGWKFEPFDLPPDDAQLLQTRAFNVQTICRWFGVPPTLVGHTEGSTTWGTGLEQINLGFLQYTLRPHLKEIEQACNSKLLPPAEQTQYYTEFNVEGLLRADSKGRAEYYGNAINRTWMTPNEVRALENLPPVEGGDHLLTQGAMMPLDILVEQAIQAAVQLAMGTMGGAPEQADDGEPGDETSQEELDAVSDDDLNGLFSPEYAAQQ
jgi:HK97 family phage portal protein